MDTDPATLSSEGTLFQVDTSQQRTLDTTADCPVVPAESEVVVQCVAGSSDEHGRRTAIVTTESDSGGVDVTVYDLGADAWVSTLRATDQAPGVTLERAPWDVLNDLFLVRVGSGVVEIVTTDAAAGSRIAGTLSIFGDMAVELIAQRVVVRDAGLDEATVTIYAPPTGGGTLSGTATHGPSAGRIPEDVALRVYRAWAANDRGGVAGLVAEDVERALFEDAPQTRDAFQLIGTSCPIERERWVCRFAVGGQVSVWDLAPVDGAIKVVRLSQE